MAKTETEKTAPEVKKEPKETMQKLEGGVAPADRKEEWVEIFIEKGSEMDEPNLMVSVNGKNYLLPKGENSKVPPEVAYEIRRSRNAQRRLDKTKSELLEKAAQK